MQIHSNEEEERGRGARKGSKRRYKDSPESQRTPSISWYVQIKVLYRDRTEMLMWRKGQKRQLTNEAFSWMGDNFCQIRQQKKKNRNKHANILVTDQFYWRKSRTETERGSGVRGQKSTMRAAYMRWGGADSGNHQKTSSHLGLKGVMWPLLL